MMMRLIALNSMQLKVLQEPIISPRKCIGIGYRRGGDWAIGYRLLGAEAQAIGYGLWAMRGSGAAVYGVKCKGEEVVHSTKLRQYAKKHIE